MALQDYLYTQTTVTDALEEYIKELSENCDDIESILHANKLKAFQNMMEDKQFVRDLRRFFNETYDLISKKHPGLQFSIAGRMKALISAEEKILQYAALEQSFDLIRDFFAFRIILFGNDSLGLIEHCYKVLEDVIEFAAIRGFTPCDRSPLVGVANIGEAQANPYYDSFKYKHFVKDYISFPKENGYQSIHLALVDTKGRCLEIQIRTLEMHAQIESGPANHSKYKKKYNAVSIPFERDKVSIYGYTYLNNQVFDLAGVEQPVIILQRQKITF